MISLDAEQRVLAEVCWQFVGLREELDHPNAWVRRSLFGTDIFIQNFAGELAGYHNVCAHRGFPLRTEESGTGPVQCGFHGWVYNRDGVPTGIPRNAELFQLSRTAQQDLALPKVRIEAIGRFVFATLSTTAPSVAEYLGPLGDQYRAIDGALGKLYYTETVPVQANWKRVVEINLDDYHLHAVHPASFGIGPTQALHRFVYRRDGRHSCLLKRRDPDWSFDPFFADLARGVPDLTGYKIFNYFPNFAVVTEHSSCALNFVAAVGEDRSVIRNYLLDWRHAPLPDPVVQGAIDFHKTIFREDRAAFEAWQTGIGGFQRPPILGKLEERVGWFRQAYDDVMLKPG